MKNSYISRIFSPINKRSVSTTTTGPSIHLQSCLVGMNPSATLAINEHSKELEQSGKKIWKLGLGQSPFPVYGQIVDELRNHAHEKDYLPVAGLPQLRETVAQYHTQRGDGNFTWQNVLIGPGSKEIMWLVQFAYASPLLVPQPSWVSYGPQAQLAGQQVQWIATEPQQGFMLTAERLQDHLEQTPTNFRGLLMLNYPSNPTGGSFNPDELQQIAEVARKHQMLVFSDEIYGELRFDGKHQSLASFYPEGTIISSGISKWAGAGGYRLGTTLFPDNLQWLQKAVAAAASETFSSVAAPIQHAAIAAFQRDQPMEKYLQDQRTIMKSVVKRVGKRLRSSGVWVKDAVGGFYILPDFRQADLTDRLRNHGIQSGPQLTQVLLEQTGVAMLPASCFGFDEDQLLVRMALVNFDGDLALQHTHKAVITDEGVLDDKWLEQYCYGPIEAIEKITDFLNHL